MPDFGDPFAGLNNSRPLDINELIRALRFSIAAEYEAVQVYTQLADSISDTDSQKVLRDISDEELVHVGELLKLVKNLSPKEEKLYEEGEKETEDTISKKSFISKLVKITSELDSVAEDIQERHPQAALHLDRIADCLEGRIAKKEEKEEKKPEEKKDKNWSEDIKTKTKIEKGIFDKGPEDIAKYFEAKEKGHLGKAIKMIDFYINRAGEGLKGKDRANVLKAEKMLEDKRRKIGK